MISPDAVALIKHFEGCKLKAYKCPAGVWTIGYGRTQGVKQGDVCTQDQADEWLVDHLTPINRQIDLYVHKPLKQHQRDALACFIYNVGANAFAGSTMCRKLNLGDYEGAAKEFGRWTKANGRELPGLITRRAAERSLFENTGKSA